MTARLLPLRILCAVLLLSAGLVACSSEEPSALGSSPTAAPGRNLLPPTWTAAPTRPPGPTASPTDRATSTALPTPTVTPVIAGTLNVVNTLTAAAPTRTPSLQGLPGSWARLDSPLLGASVAYPDLLFPVDSGGGLALVRSSANVDEDGEALLPLTVQLTPGLTALPAVPPLPVAEDYSSPRDLVEAMILELEENERLLVIREEVDTRRLGEDRAAEAVVEGEIIGPNGPEALIFYLAAVVHEDRLILMSASSPLATDGEFLPIARSIFKSLEFIAP